MKTPHMQVLQRNIPFAVFVLALGGCFKNPFPAQKGSVLSSAGATAVVQSVQANGTKSVAQYDPNLNVAQTIEASADEKLQGTTVTLEPGTLAIDAAITIEESAPLEDSGVMTEIGLTGQASVTSSGVGVVIRPSADVVASKPFTLNIPLPASNLRLQTDETLTTLAVLYKSYGTNGQLTSGLIPRKDLKLVDGKASFLAPNFGAYQTVILDIVVEQALEVPSVEPIRNVKNVVVVDKEGVKSETEIVEKEIVPELSWSTPSLSFTESSRTVTASATPSGGVSQCKLRFREGNSLSHSYEYDAADPANATAMLEKKEAITIYGRFVCIDELERTTKSPWSDALSVPAAIPPLSLSLAASSVRVGEYIGFTISGGKSPYSFSYSSTYASVVKASDVPTSAADIGSANFAIKGLSATETLQIKVSDSVGNQSSVTLAIKNQALVISIAYSTLVVGDVVGFNINGGQSPYQIDYAADYLSVSPAADFNSTDQTKLGNANYGVKAIGAITSTGITVTDAAGTSASLSVSISNPALSLTASSTIVYPSAAVSITVVGGVAPYSYTLLDSYGYPGYGYFDQQSMILSAAPYGTTETLTVTDALGNTASVSIQTVGSPYISVSRTTLRAGESMNFTVGSGLGPYTLSYDSWMQVVQFDPDSGVGTISSQSSDFGTATLTATDSFGQSTTQTFTLQGSGNLDPSFGYSGVASVSTPTSTGSGHHFYELHQSSTGYLRLGGYARRCCTGQYDDLAAVSLAQDGSTDTNFGSYGGMNLSLVGSQHNRAFASELLPDDSIVLAASFIYGTVDGSSANEIRLARVTDAGLLDTASWTNGMITFVINNYPLEVRDVAYHPMSDSILVAGTAGGRWFMTNFSSSGQHLGTIHYHPADPGEIYDLLVRSDGTILAVGEYAGMASTILLDASGFPVSGYAGGYPTTDHTGKAMRAIEDSNGRFVVVGSTATSGDGFWFVSRYLSDGSLDGSFASGGSYLNSFSAGLDVAHGLTELPDQSLVIVGSAAEDNTQSGYGVVAKLDSNGVPATGFATNGIAYYDPGSLSVNFILHDVRYQTSGAYPRLLIPMEAPGYSGSGAVIAIIP